MGNYKVFTYDCQSSIDPSQLAIGDNLPVPDFQEFLLTQLQDRNWTQRKLAQRAGLSQAAVSRVLSGQRQPGVEFCNSIARAFGIAPELVFEQAGLMHGKHLPDEFTAAEIYLVQLYREAPEILRAAAYAVLMTRK